MITAPDCPWSATLNVLPIPPWVQIAGCANGVGSGSVNYVVTAPAHSAGQAIPDSTATISVGGQTYTIQLQGGTASSYFPLAPLPLFSEGAGTSTIFTLVNTTALPASAVTTFYDTKANLVPISISTPPPAVEAPFTAAWTSQTLAPNQSFTFQSSASATSPFVSGSAYVYGVNGFAILHNDNTRQEALVPPGGSGEQVTFDNTGDAQTGIGVVGSYLGLESPFPSPYISTLSFFDDSGSLLGSQAIQLPALSQTWIPLATQFPFTANKRGTVTFGRTCYPNVCYPVTTLGIRYTSQGAATTLPPLGGGTLPHFAAGGGWQTTFVLTNPGAPIFGDPPTTVQVSFYDDGGNPLALPMVFPQTGATTTSSSFKATLPVYRQYIVQTAAAPTDPLVTGSAHFNGGFAAGGGYAIMRYIPNGQEVVEPFGAPAAGRGYVIAFDNTDSIATGIAVSNGSALAVTVPVVIRDEQGNQIGADSIPLAANGHTSFVLSAKYPATANIRGTIEFDIPGAGTSTPAPIAVLGLRAPPQSTFTLLPALPK